MSDNTLCPFLSRASGTLFVCSRDVAKHFGLEHGNILKAIRAKIAILGARAGKHHFKAKEYMSMPGQYRPAFDLTAEGFSLVSSTFRGDKAKAKRARCLEAFGSIDAQRFAFMHPDADPREQASYILKPSFGEGVICPPTLYLDFGGCIIRACDMDGQRWWSARDVAGACGLAVPIKAKRLQVGPENIRRVSLRSAWGNRAAQGLVMVVAEPALLDWIKRSGKRNVKQFLNLVSFAALPHPSTCPALPQQ